MTISFKHLQLYICFLLRVSVGLEKTRFLSKEIWTLLPLEEEGTD